MLIHIVRKRFIMKWTWDLFNELKDLVYSIEALENNYYDTHNLDYIEKTKGDIESRIEYLTENLPVKDTDITDYDWNFDKDEIVFLNVA